MNTSFKTAADFRKHLELNLRIHSTKTGENIQRLRRKVAFDRLLARIFTQEPSSFFLKGGYAMELRIAHARATKDMDLTCKTAAEKAERQRLNRLAREKRLNEITGRESILWNQIESLASEKKAASYDKAIELLIDLRDLAARGDRREFLLKFDTLKQRHSNKSSFIGRLRNLDLWESTANETPKNIYVSRS